MYEGKLISEALDMTFNALDRNAYTGPERRKSTVLNSTVRPAGGPNGFGHEAHPDGRILTDEDELAALDRACEDENATLKACCESAARELVLITTSPSIKWVNKIQAINHYAAVIYKHMRNGREL